MDAGQQYTAGTKPDVVPDDYCLGQVFFVVSEADSHDFDGIGYAAILSYRNAAVNGVYDDVVVDGSIGSYCYVPPPKNDASAV